MFEPIKEALHQFLGGWQPENAQDIRDGLGDDGIPSVFEDFGRAMQMLGDRMTSEMPIDATVAAHVTDLGGQLMSMADQARDARKILESAHEVELNRLDNPRPAEEAWDLRT